MKNNFEWFLCVLLLGTLACGKDKSTNYNLTPYEKASSELAGNYQIYSGIHYQPSEEDPNWEGFDLYDNFTTHYSPFKFP